VVYPLGLRAWGYRITDRGTDQGAYGRGCHPDQISAQLAAEEDLRHFECDPRALGVTPLRTSEVGRLFHRTCG
jgi:hypothetical protein